jgi:hypothetical protein
MSIGQVAWWLVVTIALAGRAGAKPCGWRDINLHVFDRATVKRAATVLKQYPTYVEYCIPCRDAGPSAPVVAHEVDVDTVGEPDGSVDVISNGDRLNLADTYVQVSADRYVNLAALAGCPFDDIPQTLPVVPPRPMPQALPVVPARTMPPEPAVPERPMPQRCEARSDGPGWYLVALALAGATAGIGGTIARARRKRAPLPRATELGG